MASKISTAHSLRVSPRHTPTSTDSRLAIAALVAGLSAAVIAKPNTAHAQTPTHGRLRPVYVVPVDSTAGNAVTAIVTATPATPTTNNGNMDFSGSRTALVQQPAAPAVVAQPTVAATPTYVAPSDSINYLQATPAAPIAESTSGGRETGWFGGVGLTTVFVPNLFRDPEAQQNNLGVSAGNCLPERSATGNAGGRYICSLTFTGGNNQYTITPSNGAEVTAAPGMGRNATVAIPGNSLSTLQVTSNGVSRTFNVTTRPEGMNRTFSSAQVGETNAPESPVRVTVIPAIEAHLGRHFGQHWSMLMSARLGSGVTLNRPDLWYVGGRIGAEYQGGRGSILRAGFRTGVDAFVIEGSTNRTAVPFELTGRILTNGNPRRAAGFFEISAGASVPTDGATTNFIGSVGAGLLVR